VDQNFDHYSVEYTFDDGTKMYMDGRNELGCEEIYSSAVHGSKGMAIAANSGDYSPPSSIFTSQKPSRANLVWTSKSIPGQDDPYDNEWNDLVEAIRNDKPYNEVPRGVAASVTTSMGRMAAHTGQEITYEEMLNHEDVYAPGVENFTMDSPPPLRSGPDGKYPVPMPGLIGRHEFKVS
jgi:predicted dehydrogenase